MSPLHVSITLPESPTIKESTHHLRNFHMSDKCQEFLWFYSLLMLRNPDSETSNFPRAGGRQCLSRLSKLSMLSLQPSSPCHIRKLLAPSCHSQGLECSFPWSSSSSECGLSAEAQVTALMVVHQITEEKDFAGFLPE